MTEFNKLFANLTPLELEITQELQQIIQSEIQVNNGVISFRRYMELALYYPQLGYYSNRLFKFGANGDFVTAPLISNLFGHLIARQLRELFSFGVQAQVLEFGAGNGKLAADILASIGDHLDKYYIIELSADLALWQKETLIKHVPHLLHKVEWLTTLPNKFDGVMLANEVLDAQPCDLVRYVDGQVRGVGVSYSESKKFHYVDCALDENTLTVANDLNLDYHDYITEIHTASIGFINSLAACLNRGAILLIDYGVGEPEYYHPHNVRGTLRGFFRQHLLDEVLHFPGLIDITASVNWTGIINSAIVAELEFIGYTNQGSFLINCGLTELMQEIQQEVSEAQYLQISNQVNKLVAQNEMGDSFKVCGFSKFLEQDTWLGFRNNDKSYTL